MKDKRDHIRKIFKAVLHRLSEFEEFALVETLPGVGPEMGSPIGIFVGRGGQFTVFRVVAPDYVNEETQWVWAQMSVDAALNKLRALPPGEPDPPAEKP